MSDPTAGYNKVLDQVLKLTERVVNEYNAAQPDSPNRYVCRGKLLALSEVIGYFSGVDVKAFAVTTH